MEKNEKSTSLFADMPTGLSYALSRNVSAMRTFCELPDDKRQQIVNNAKVIGTKKEMRSLVDNIAKNKYT